jgi:hypothetical protein
MIVQGLRRLSLITGSLVAVAVVPAAMVAALTSMSLARAVSLGLMLMGSFLFVAGAAVGLRGPARHTHRPDGGVDGFTFASTSERIESINVSHLLVGIGIVLALVGVVIAPNVRLG